VTLSRADRAVAKLRKPDHSALCHSEWVTKDN
jgi:hypothetical protein